MTFRFKIQLKDITDPPVWRRVLVPAQFSFLRLHKVIQVAFGWKNSHLFEFSNKGYEPDMLIAIPFEDDDEFPFESFAKKLPAAKVKLSAIFTEPKQQFIYTYDFGDNWVHQLTLEKIIDEQSARASFLAGKGACPPEDCGGPGGYANLKEILADSKHPEHTDIKKWLGLTPEEKWDAETFDLETTIKLVNKI